jgi:hypothetical protein
MVVVLHQLRERNIEVNKKAPRQDYVYTTLLDIFCQALSNFLS